MTIQNGYSMTLDTSVNAGGAVTYAVVVPISVAGDVFRPVFEAGPPMANVYVHRKGAGALDFQAEGMPVLRADNSPTWTPSGAADFLAPIALSVAVGDSLVFVFDTNGAANYKKKSTGGQYHWKVPAVGVANKNATHPGFTSGAPMTAFVKAVEVGSAEDFAIGGGGGSSPPPSVQCNWSSSGSADIEANKIFSGGGYFAGTPGQRLHFSLFAPATRKVSLLQVLMRLDVPGLVTMRAILPPVTGAIIQESCNLNFDDNAPPSVAKLRMYSNAAEQGVFHSIHTPWAAPYPEGPLNYLDKPMSVMWPGETGTIFALPAGVGCMIQAYWREDPV